MVTDSRLERVVISDADNGGRKAIPILTYFRNEGLEVHIFLTLRHPDLHLMISTS